MSSNFESARLTAGQLDTIVEKLGGYSGAIGFLMGESSVINRKWRFKNSSLHFLVVSNGMPGPLWVEHFEEKGVVKVQDYAKNALHSPDFKPTNGVITEIVVLDGRYFLRNKEEEIRKHARKNNLITPNAETACLIRDAFSDKAIKAMGFESIVVMHNHIKDFDGAPLLLAIGYDKAGSWLFADYDDPNICWTGLPNFDSTSFAGCGFAFAVSQVSSL